MPGTEGLRGRLHRRLPGRVSYHVRMTINVSSHRYDAYVTPAGGQEQQIASGYAFRTEQQAVTALDTWSTNSSVGSLRVWQR